MTFLLASLFHLLVANSTGNKSENRIYLVHLVLKWMGDSKLKHEIIRIEMSTYSADSSHVSEHEE